MLVLFDWFTSLFLVFFKLLFPLFQNPVLLTFIAILVIETSLMYVLFQWIKRHKGFKSSGKQLFLFVASLFLELFLVVYWLWFVSIHFWTFRLLN